MKFSPSPVDHRTGPRCLPAWKIPERYGKFPKNDQRGSKKTPDQRWSPMNLFAKKTQLEIMKVKTMAEMKAAGEQPEILFWVGCAGSFDSRAQQISRKLV